jgi:hypothetical protein
LRAREERGARSQRVAVAPRRLRQTAERRGAHRALRRHDDAARIGALLEIERVRGEELGSDRVAVRLRELRLLDEHLAEAAPRGRGARVGLLLVVDGAALGDERPVARRDHAPIRDDGQHQEGRQSHRRRDDRGAVTRQEASEKLERRILVRAHAGA